MDLKHMKTIFSSNILLLIAKLMKICPDDMISMFIVTRERQNTSLFFFYPAWTESSSILRRSINIHYYHNTANFEKWLKRESENSIRILRIYRCLQGTRSLFRDPLDFVSFSSVISLRLHHQYWSNDRWQRRARRVRMYQDYCIRTCHHEHDVWRTQIPRFPEIRLPHQDDRDSYDEKM